MINFKEESTADLIKKDISYMQDIDKVSGVTGAMLIEASSKIREELDRRMILELQHVWDCIAGDYLAMYEHHECPAEDIHLSIWDFVDVIQSDKDLVKHFQQFNSEIRLRIAREAFPYESYCD